MYFFLCSKNQFVRKQKGIHNQLILLFSRQKATLEKIHESNPSLTGKLNRIIP
jgi:hypothetical protein